MAPDIHGIADEIIVHVPLALLAEPFQVPRVVDALDIPGGCRDRIMAGDLLRQPVDDTEEPVLALDMPLAVVLLEDRAGDCGIVHQVPRVKTGIRYSRSTVLNIMAGTGCCAFPARRDRNTTPLSAHNPIFPVLRGYNEVARPGRFLRICTLKKYQYIFIVTGYR
jgi:hypothetical protein